MIFSMATSIGTNPTNSRKVEYGVGGQAIQSNKPEKIAKRMFFFISLA